MEKTNKKFNIITKIIIILVLLIVLVYCWMHFVETKLIVVKDYILINEKIPKAFNGFTIAHFSDIHFGRTTNEQEVNKVVDKINEMKPDIVLFSGDLFDPYINLSDDNINFLKDAFKNINANIKKYAVYGDHDLENKEKYDDILNYANFELLNGENKTIYYNDNNPIYISGSHTLGGLIRLPFIGGIKKNQNSLSFEKGKYLEGKTTLFVNNGIGTEDISLRLFNYPTIYCYRFQV